MSEQSSKMIPPYVTWGVFKSTMDTLAETTVPSGPLDRRVLYWLSGADHGALLSALRFLGLADFQNRATDRYCKLIEYSKANSGASDQFREDLMTLLDEKYRTILERVDIQRGTISELEKAFREEMEVAQGQMMTKTIRFFIKAYTDGAGLTIMSPHITKPKPKKRAVAKSNASEKPAKRNAILNTDTDHEKQIARDVVPEGFARLPIPGMEGAFIQYPKDLTEQQCTVFDGAVQMLRVYVTYIRSGQVTVQDLMGGLKK